MSHETLGLLLVREGLISRPELYDALRLQRQNNRLLGSCLLSLGYVKPETLLNMLSMQLAIPALPPGSLGHAAAEALQRVPREVVLRLRVLPYSWDGEMLGVAVADGRVLAHLQEVAYHAQSAVGAYVALETDIENALKEFYPDLPDVASEALAGRPRPPQIAEPPPLPPKAAEPVPVAPTPPPAPPPEPVIASAPPPVAMQTLAIQRVSFFDAVEEIYAATDVDGVARLIGQALLNFFNRVVLAVANEQRFRLVGCCGVTPRRVDVPSSALPLITKRMSERRFTYGLESLDVRAAELVGVLGIEKGATALIGTVSDGLTRVVVFADNGASSELYEELHDIELLFKEAETALGMLPKPS